MEDYIPPKPTLSLQAMLAGYIVEKKAKPKRGGVNSQITEQRILASEILARPLLQVCRLTKGWTGDQLYQLNRTAQSFKANPPALWWKEYKSLKNIYGGKHKSTDDCMGNPGGRGKQEEGQGVLFKDREERCKEEMGKEKSSPQEEGGKENNIKEKSN